MPNNTYKSAAVPFVNQKGERSMKRVKVERYVAGKKPGYAKDEDEEDYYTTDDEEDDFKEEQDSSKEEKSDDDDVDDEDDYLAQKPRVVASHSKAESSLSQTDPSNIKMEDYNGDDDDDSDEDFDDPRFRRLKELEKTIDSSRLIDAQTSSRTLQKFEDNKVVIDDDEDEEEIKQRHAIARARTLEAPTGPQIVLGDLIDQQFDLKQKISDFREGAKREETEDILKDLVLTGIPQSRVVQDEAKIEENIKDMIEQAKQEAIFKEQLLKKVEEDTKRDMELEARKKNDFASRDLNSVNTDDEDEEIAYEEWKLREIKRVLRDRSERILETKAR